MATDNSKYEIVQISESDWAIQYSDGSLSSGYKTRQEAIDTALDIATNNPTAETFSTPRTLEEALVVGQNARDNYRNFIGNNPNASQEQKDALIAEIMRADAQASEYQAQLAMERIQSTAAEVDKIATFELQMRNADKARSEAIGNAAYVRNNGTPAEIEKAESDAFQAELYYQSLKQEKEGMAQTIGADSDFQGAGLFSGGSSEYASAGGQILNSNSEVNASLDSSIDLTKTSLNNEFGSITRTGLTGNSIATGYGSTNQNGNTIYDTALGVTSVANSSDQRVKLSPKPSQREKIFSGVLEPLKETGGLVFPYTPTITLQASTNYNTLETTHANQNWHIYQNTPSIDVTIQGMFTAQNETEAKYLLACIHFLRVLTKMHFGSSDSNKGLPPPQVLLDGYGTHMFNGLSVIVKNYNVQLPDNVDYVQVTSGGGVSKVPAVTTLDVLVTIQQTPKKSKEFNWDSFADGSLMQQKGWL